MFFLRQSTLSAEVLSRHSNSIFIETGSFMGGGILSALQCEIPKIYSIEIHKPFYEFCKATFQPEGQVRLYSGDTCSMLPQILEEIEGPATFWLDAHKEPGAVVGDKDVPLLEELDIIAGHKIKNHTILIDDMGQLDIPTSMGWQDIKIEDITDRVYAINKEYEISYEAQFGAKEGDYHILVAKV